jgi:hypothetical protein
MSKLPLSIAAYYRCKLLVWRAFFGLNSAFSYKSTIGGRIFGAKTMAASTCRMSALRQ